MKIEKSLKFIPWWFWIAGIDLVLIFATALQHSFFVPTLVRRILRQFDLGQEMNLAAWWSGMILFSIALLCYEIYCDRNNQKKVTWLLLTIAFTCLSIDEIGSIHERIETWIQLIDPYVSLSLIQLIDPYIPIAILGVILVPFPLIILWNSQETRRTAILLIVGFLFLASIAIQERLEGYIEWYQWGGVRLGVEEGTELLGMFFCYLGVVLQRHQPQSTNKLICAVPNPFLMRNLQKIISGGIIVHLCLIIFVSIYINIDYSGRTLVWYPVAILFLLSLTIYWKYSIFEYPQHRIWYIFSAYFFVSSAITPYLIYPSISHKLPALIEPNFYYLYGFQLLLIIIIYKLIYQTISKKAFILIFLLVISLLLGSRIPGEIARYTVAGAFSYLVARLLLFDLLKPLKRST
ncbi:MAG: hypothetical protein WBM86_30555 [Waterburya sp.]